MEEQKELLQKLCGELEDEGCVNVYHQWVAKDYWWYSYVRPEMEATEQ